MWRMGAEDKNENGKSNINERCWVSPEWDGSENRDKRTDLEYILQVVKTGLTDRKGIGREGKCGIKDKSWFFCLRNWAVGVAIYYIQSVTPTRYTMQGIWDGYSIIFIYLFSTINWMLAV